MAQQPPDYRTYQGDLGPPWLQGDGGQIDGQQPRQQGGGRNWNEGLGEAKDQFCALCAEVVRARYIPSTDEQALGHLGAERNIERAPGEGLEAYRLRVLTAWEFWPMGGTRPGMEWALASLGYTVQLIEHGHPPPLGDGSGTAVGDNPWYHEFSIYLSPIPPIVWITATWDGPAGEVWDRPRILWDTAMTQAEAGRIARIVCKMKAGHSKPRHIYYSGGPLPFWDAPGVTWDDPAGLPWDGPAGMVEVPISTERTCRGIYQETAIP